MRLAPSFFFISRLSLSLSDHNFSFQDERLGSTQLVGLGLAFVGIVVAFGESFTFPTRRMLIGDSMLVCAAIFWGATTVVIKAGPLVKVSASKTLFYQLAVSATSAADRLTGSERAGYRQCFIAGDRKPAVSNGLDCFDYVSGVVLAYPTLSSAQARLIYVSHSAFWCISRLSGARRATHDGVASGHGNGRSGHFPG